MIEQWSTKTNDVGSTPRYTARVTAMTAPYNDLVVDGVKERKSYVMISFYVIVIVFASK